MANDELNAELRRLRKAVTRKISRIKTGQDIHLSGTRLDPRKAASTIANMAEPQRREYAREMAHFLDRGNQFVPDSQMRPMPRDVWRNYKRLEAQWNKKVRAHNEGVGDIVLPDGLTVAQRQASLQALHPQMANPAVNGPSEIERESTNVASVSSLKNLTEKMRERLEPGHFEKLVESGRETFNKMADVIGDESFRQSVNDLTPQQFEILWTWTPFAAATSIHYELAMKELSPRDKETWAGTALDNAVKEMKKDVEWARKLQR